MIFWFLLMNILFSGLASATAMLQCGPGQLRIAHPMGGVQCVQRFPQQRPADCIICQGTQPAMAFPNWFGHFPAAIYQPQPLPWWASQGNLYYPNLHYPGAWNYPGMQPRHYPGEGPVFAAKPNVYVESIHQERKFNFRFVSEQPLSFLATTPVLAADHSWSGKIVNQDKLEVEGINYDYLFYDIRLSKQHMQFEHGVCATREAAINWMLQDLKELLYPAVALQDFEEHWKVKIPDYPFYCIYPQYNQQLDATLPVTIQLEQSSFIRSLYILVPHKSEPDADEPQWVALPFKEHESLRPAVKIKRENMFREWGVAFLEHQ
jgi:hypothetical protein